MIDVEKEPRHHYCPTCGKVKVYDAQGIFVDPSCIDWCACSSDLAKKHQDEKNAIYAERNLCVALIAQWAKGLDYHVGIKEHQGADWEDEWRHVLFIDLPSGQVSWHLHDSELVNFPGIGTYGGEWDGHTTEEKYKRVKDFIRILAWATKSEGA